MIDYVPDILKKYNYDLPKIPSYKFNERLKELGKKAKLKQKIEIVRKKGSVRVKDVHEKWEMISSHTCRRSFCTNMYLSGFPAEELMRISGHKSPAAFMRYIKVDNMQAANRLKALRNSLRVTGFFFIEELNENVSITNYLLRCHADSLTVFASISSSVKIANKS